MEKKRGKIITRIAFGYFIFNYRSSKQKNLVSPKTRFLNTCDFTEITLNDSQELVTCVA